MDTGAKIIVLPGSPEVAETIEVTVVNGPANANYRLEVDGAITASMTADANGDLSTSVSAAGLEAKLANFGAATRHQLTTIPMGIVVGVGVGLHTLRLRML